jgi:hypothetical protein
LTFEEQVQGDGQRVLPAREARRVAQPGSLEQAGEQLSPAGAASGVIQAHEGRGQPEPFVFLYLQAQLRLGLHRLPITDFPLLRGLAPVLVGYTAPPNSDAASTSCSPGSPPP